MRFVHVGFVNHGPGVTERSRERPQVQQIHLLWDVSIPSRQLWHKKSVLAISTCNVKTAAAGQTAYHLTAFFCNSCAATECAESATPEALLFQDL